MKTGCTQCIMRRAGRQARAVLASSCLARAEIQIRMRLGLRCVAVHQSIPICITGQVRVRLVRAVMRVIAWLLSCI